MAEVPLIPAWRARRADRRRQRRADPAHLGAVLEAGVQTGGADGSAAAVPAVNAPPIATPRLRGADPTRTCLASTASPSPHTSPAWSTAAVVMLLLPDALAVDAERCRQLGIVPCAQADRPDRVARRALSA
jgi:hypothetical protein